MQQPFQVLRTAFVATPPHSLALALLPPPFFWAVHLLVDGARWGEIDIISMAEHSQSFILIENYSISSLTTTAAIKSFDQCLEQHKIYRYKHIYYEYNLTTWLFRKITSIGSPLGPRLLKSWVLSVFTTPGMKSLLWSSPQIQSREHLVISMNSFTNIALADTSGLEGWYCSLAGFTWVTSVPFECWLALSWVLPQLTEGQKEGYFSQGKKYFKDNVHHLPMSWGKYHIKK